MGKKVNCGSGHHYNGLYPNTVHYLGIGAISDNSQGFAKCPFVWFGQHVTDCKQLFLS